MTECILSDSASKLSDNEFADLIVSRYNESFDRDKLTPLDNFTQSIYKKALQRGDKRLISIVEKWV
jgi:hypothetical protein